MSVGEMVIDPQLLQQARCWFDVDRVPRRPEVTAFKRRARLSQARWREAQGLAIGSHRPPGRDKDTPNGSRLTAADAAKGHNFLSDRIRAAVADRLANKQPHETLDRGRLERDLLSSMPMCFNLFGDLHDDRRRRKAAVAELWPAMVGEPQEIRFEWSPGRRDSTYLGDRTAFDAAVVLDRPDGGHGIIGIETKYHEHATREARPNERTRLPRYLEVARRSGAFKSGWEDEVLGTELQQIWRDHLLLLAMLQQADKWRQGIYVLVHPAGNQSFAEVATRYRGVLEDDSTFEIRTIEELLAHHVLHTAPLEKGFRARYLWGDG